MNRYTGGKLNLPAQYILCKALIMHYIFYIINIYIFFTYLCYHLKCVFFKVGTVAYLGVITYRLYFDVS